MIRLCPQQFFAQHKRYVQRVFRPGFLSRMFQFIGKSHAALQFFQNKRLFRERCHRQRYFSAACRHAVLLQQKDAVILCRIGKQVFIFYRKTIFGKGYADVLVIEFYFLHLR